MSTPALTAEELIAWNDATSHQWRTFVTENPTVLAVQCDIYKAETVGQLLQHIVAAELRYAERLAELPVSDYAAIPYATSDDIYATHDRALSILRTLLADPTYDWNAQLEFNTLTQGRRRSSRRSILFHAMLHGIRHYAQLTTLVRQAGFSPKMALDYLLMDSQPI